MICVRVGYRDPAKRQDEIITLAEAAKRFGIDEREVGWLERGEVAGTGVSDPEVYMLHRYTPDDRIRDAAHDLLAACKAVANWAIHSGAIREPLDIGMIETVSAAINKAEGK